MKKRLFTLLLCLLLLLSSIPFAGVVYAGSAAIGIVQVDDSLSVRTGPGTGYSRVGYLYGGDVITIHETVDTGNGAWHRISRGGLQGYASADYIVLHADYQWDAAFEEYLTAQGFPESYKPALRQLHAVYPQWVFHATPLTMTWEEATTAQSRVGKNTIQQPVAWRSMEYGAYDWNTGSYIPFDSGGWYSAKPAVIRYYMDPRNFLDSCRIFQFEELSFSAEETAEAVRAILPDVFDQYADLLLEAGRENGISAYHLATRMTQEGSQYNGLGTGTVPGYEGYYNFFHYGASAGGGNSAVTNGAIYAQNQGWNTPEKCIRDSAASLAKSYIKLGQDTVYYQKFNVVNTISGLYSHQYMTNVEAPYSEAALRRRKLTADLMNLNLIFDIPVYLEMPAEPATAPSTVGNNNNFLDSITVGSYSLTPTFDRYTSDYALHVEDNTKGVWLTAQPNDGGATLEGDGWIATPPGTRRVSLTVTATSGETRTYTVAITRSGGDSFPDGLNYIDDIWYYCRDGHIDWSFTGITAYYGTQYYVRNGMLDWGAEGSVYYDGGFYYVRGGIAVTNSWLQDAHGWYYVGEDGRMLTRRWVMDSIGWCYVGADGYCVKNAWVADSIGWCYLGADGRMVTNAWMMDSVGWCYVGADGYCVTNAWVADSIGWCYLGADGRMVTNAWVMDSVGWCYVGADGYCVTNAWVADSIGWCYLGEDGRMVYDRWVMDSVGWCYIGVDGYWKP